MFALKNLNLSEYFSQLYADSSPTREPSSAGRQMNNHFSLSYLNKKGELWLNQTRLKKYFI